MSDVYLVRCNFSRPDLEERWHAWYSGPKLAEMMTAWLAAWVVESPQAFETPEYKASWGFVDWAPYITDWSRNLFRGPDAA
jgi:hypothetical protein